MPSLYACMEDEKRSLSRSYKKLREENEKLKRENEKLRLQLSNIHKEFRERGMLSEREFLELIK